MNAFIAIIIIMLGWVAEQAHAAEPTPLNSNPFNRPSSLAVAGDSSVGIAEGTIERLIQLRSTMVGANTMLADVGGRILRPGDVIDDVKLLRVFEDRATFSINGNIVTVMVKPLLDESDD